MSSVYQDQPSRGEGEGGGDVILFIAFVSVKLKSEKKEKFYNIFVSSNPYIIRMIGFSNY